MHRTATRDHHAVPTPGPGYSPDPDPDVDVDVLVVGAGPVGASAAVTLARWGLEVDLVDADAGPTTQSRAVWVHPRTVELLEEMGVAGPARDEGVLMDRIDVHHGGRHGGSIHYEGAGRTRFPGGLVLEQSRTQRLLLDAAARSGVTARWGRRLVALEQGPRAVLARLEGPDGATSTVRARWVVGADGATSTVRGQIGLRLVGDTYDTSFFTGDLRLRVPLHPRRAHLSVTRDRTFALLPLAGTDRWRVVATVPPAVEASLGRDAGPTGGPALSVDQVVSLLEGLEVEHHLEVVDWATLYRSHHRVVDTFVVGRVLLAGDAAHVHSPAGGLGMNTGIGDAVNAGWRLGMALSRDDDDLAARLVDQYAAERRGVARQVLRTSDKVFTLQAGSGRVLGLARALLMPRVPAVVNLTERGRRLAFDVLSQLSVTYADRRRRRGAGTRVGDRLPYAVEASGTTSHDHLGLDRFLLLAVGDQAAGEGLGALGDVTARHGLPTTTQVVPASSARALGLEAGEVVLVRPDGHVWWRGSVCDPGSLAAALTDVGVVPAGARSR